MFHVYFDPAVSRALRTCGLTRVNVLRLLNQLYDQLENHGGDWRRFRDASDADRQCLYWDVVAQDGNWHVLTFRVDDATAQDYLIVRSVEREIRPMLGGE